MITSATTLATTSRPLVEMTARIDKRFDDFATRLDLRFARLERLMAASDARLLRWMIGFWITNTLALVGLAFAVLRIPYAL